jgi:hypothetical protein
MVRIVNPSLVSASALVGLGCGPDAERVVSGQDHACAIQAAVAEGCP